MKLLFAMPHLVARKSLSNNDRTICGERKSITMACKLAKFPQQNCLVQNQFRGPGQRHHVPRRLFKHSAGHTVEALYFYEQWIMSKRWSLYEHKHCIHWWCFVFVSADRFEITGGTKLLGSQPAMISTARWNQSRPIFRVMASTFRLQAVL